MRHTVNPRRCFCSHGCLPLLAALALSLFVASSAHAQLRIVTTTTDLGDFARSIGGAEVRVDTICRGAQDPHFVQARPSYMVTLSRADLVIAVGLDLEVGWLPALIAGARNPDINPGRRGYMETATAISPLDVPRGPVDRSGGDIHARGNPHFWLDPLQAKLAARAIMERMAELDPGGADAFRSNLRAFDERIDRAMARWTKVMAPYRGTKIVSYHRTFNYFHNRFGLVDVGYVEDRPGIPPAPAHLARLIRQVSADSVPVIFHEIYYDRAASDVVGKRAGARVLVLPTSVGAVSAASSYERLIDHIVSTFVAAMGHDRAGPRP